jgi:hypothetical protein
MTTSGRGSESSAEPPAEAGPGGTVPENEQELRQEIEQTRERLGDTVELLVAKTDIKGRAQAKVAGLTGRVKGKSAPARSKSADRAANARSQVTGKSLMARQKATAGRDHFGPGQPGHGKPPRKASGAPPSRAPTPPASTGCRWRRHWSRWAAGIWRSGCGRDVDRADLPQTRPGVQGGHGP